MMNRLVRAFDTLSRVENDAQTRGGMRGEDYAEYIIESGQDLSVRNPIIPHPNRRGYYLETDFLVYSRGTLYAVEIKNYRGKVYYPTRSHVEQVQKGWFIFKRSVPVTVVDGFDYTKLVQEKRDYNKNTISKREFPNPFTKTQDYIEDLKRYLYRLDARFANIPIYPALGFAEKTDISTIYNFEGGIMHISQLPAFFEKYANPTVSTASDQWIRQALHRLPTWDRIFTTGNEWINGVLDEVALTFRETNGQPRSIPYNRIRAIVFEREGRFSAYDVVTITFTDGKQQSFHSKDGEVRLRHFGEMQTHKFRNINSLLVGIANRQV
jgi:hypothetical protein